MLGLKLERAVFHNFAGLKAGTRKSKIEIDFTKMKNNICLVIGSNGCGKTSLLESLHPKAYNVSEDRSGNSYNLIVDGKDGYKELLYKVNGEDIRYKILHNYEATKKGRRVKSYITKYVEDEVIELNPNGNVTSFNQALELELGFNDTILELVRLGVSMGGLINRSSTERKKYAGELLSKLQIYLHYHKITSAKYRIAKTSLKSISEKIAKLRYVDESEIVSIMKKLEKEKSSIDNEIYQLKKDMDDLRREKDESKDIMEKYKDLSDTFSKYKSNKSKVENSIYDIENISTILNLAEEDKMSGYREISDRVTALKTKYAVLKSKRETSLMSLSDIEASMSREDLDSRDESIYDELEKYKALMDEVKGKIREYESVYNFKKNMKVKCDLSQLTTAKEYAVKIQDIIEGKMCEFDLHDISQYYEILKCGEISELEKRYDKALSKDVKFNSQLKELQNTYSKYRDKKEFADILNERPDSCKIDDCPFISEALKYSDIIDELYRIEDDMDTIYKKISMNNISLLGLSSYMDIHIAVEEIYDFVKTNVSILEIIPNYKDIKSPKKLCSTIMNSRVGFIDEGLDEMVDDLKEFQYYKELVDVKLPNLNNEYLELQKAEAIYRKHSEISAKRDELLSNITAIDKSLRDMESDILYAEKIKADYEVYIDLSRELEVINSEMISIKDEYQAIKDAVSRIKNVDSNILNMQNALNIKYVKLESLEEEMDNIKYNLKQFKELKEEKDALEYEVKELELLTDSLSTRKGIPLEFMDIYLAKTRGIANDLLKECFNGELILLPFDINEDEFVMPLAIGNTGMINPDIKMASGGQRSLISTILSFALINQNSTKYNIMVLDEVDGTLDAYHRKFFISMLESQMEDIGSEQAFVISHNPEFAKYDVDAIIMDKEDRDLGNSVNVIYRI